MRFSTMLSQLKEFPLKETLIKWKEALGPQRLVGLDIGMSGIKAVELVLGKHPRIAAYNRIPLPWEAINQDGEWLDKEVIISALKKLFDSGCFSTKKVAVGASGKSIMIKKVSLPKMPEKELRHQLYFEAEQYLPFSLEDVNVDFAVIGDSESGSEEAPKMDVLLVAAKKDYVSQKIQNLQEAGLKPVILDTESFALGNIFEFNYAHLLNLTKGLTSVIVDCGAARTRVTILDGDRACFTRELRTSGMTCTQALSEQINVGLIEAETMKITQSDQPHVMRVIKEHNHRLVQEVQQSIDFYLNQETNKKLSSVFVSGGASRALGLLEELKNSMDVAVDYLNPLQSISGSGKELNREAISDLTYLGAVALGLSMRESGDMKI